jgi:cytoskeletal protein CcmA (bactofilin family)
MSSLIVNDDLTIDLDKPLQVSGNLFVAGTVHSNSTLSIDGTAVVNGNFIGKTLAAVGGIQIQASLELSGSLRSNKKVIIGVGRVTGDIVINRSLFVSRGLDVQGDVAIGETLQLGSFSTFNGLLVAGILIDAKDAFTCNGSVKLAGNIVETYARICIADSVVIKMGDVICGRVAGVEVEPILGSKKYCDDLAKEDPLQLTHFKSTLLTLRKILPHIEKPISKSQVDEKESD